MARRIVPLPSASSSELLRFACGDVAAAMDGGELEVRRFAPMGSHTLLFDYDVRVSSRAGPVGRAPAVVVRYVIRVVCATLGWYDDPSPLRMLALDSVCSPTPVTRPVAPLNNYTFQKRRLALSVALAEKRPIIVLDEFAADQDPVRRALFYDILVPQMARDGHLVLAVTHDEHRFAQCDRLIRMEAGQIVSDERMDGGARKAV